jgi:hypothetical protein
MHFHTDGSNQPFEAAEEFPTNLALRIEYRLGEHDLNLFCADEK